MGRSLRTLIVLGLIAWGCHWAWERWFAGPDDSGAPVVVVEGSPAHANGLRDPAAGTTAAALPAPAAAAERSLRSALDAGDLRDAVQRARGLEPEVLRSPVVAGLAREAALGLARSDGAGPGDRIARADEARRLLGRLFVAEAVDWEAIREPLERLNDEVLLSRREVPGAVFRYTVKPGDNLATLMRTTWKDRVHAGFGLVLWLNSIPSPERMRAVPISVPEEPVRLVVRKSAYRVWLLLGEVPLRSWPVGLGMQGRTPEGVFEIEELMPKPPYWPPQGGRIPFGHPDNPLGSRWLGFRDKPDAQGFGIHGTSDPESIGKDLSQGCVRLRNGDVEQLFDWVTVGTRVEIRP